MNKKILLTSFDIWLPHHTTNASDDLLAELLKRNLLLNNFYLVRKLPVEFQQAPEQVIAKLERVQPDIVVCCGMAESRDKLTVEVTATYGNRVLQTLVNVEWLVAGLTITEVSYDAGEYVCEHLYYSVLDYLRQSGQPQIPCIFVHVPLLKPEKSDLIVQDFLVILERLEGLVK